MSLAGENSTVLDLDSGFRKLLASHLSVYDALTNPDLDANESEDPEAVPENKFLAVSPMNVSPLPPLSARDRNSPVQSWQTVNLPADSLPDFVRPFRFSSPFSCASPRPASASILSNSTDDELPSESLVMVPSVSKLKVLVFETDEEDNDPIDANELKLVTSRGKTTGATAGFDDDDKTLIPPTQINSVPAFLNKQNSHQSFVMPKMSLSQDSVKFQLTIISGNNEAMNQECNGLIAMLESTVHPPSSSTHLHVSYLALSQIPLKLELSLIHNSDCLFIVNDGLLVLGEAMTAVAGSVSEDVSLSKVTIINILTTNYFINLFDIINSVNPYQIWKTTTFKTEKLSDRIKAYVESEMAAHKKRPVSKKSKKLAKGKKARRNRGSRSLSTEKMSTCQLSQDYKSLLTTLQDELAASLGLTEIDPLSFSSSLNHLKAFVNNVPKSFPFGSPDDPKSLKQLLIICGFSVGVGMGILLGTTKLVQFAYRQFKRLKEVSQASLASSKPESLVEISVLPSDFSTVLVTDKFHKATEYFMEGLDDVYTQFIVKSPCSNLMTSFGWFIDKLVAEVRDLSASVALSAQDGLDKSVSMLSSIL